MTTVEIIRNVFRSGFDLRELAWTAWVEPGRIGVEHYTLWAPDGDVEDSVGLLLRFPPGAHGDFHEHLGYELMLVLDGTLEHSDGDVVRARRPRGRGARHPSPDVEQHRLHRARDPDPVRPRTASRSRARSPRAVLLLCPFPLSDRLPSGTNRPDPSAPRSWRSVVRAHADRHHG